VLYLLHGSSDTEETWTKVGRANIILDNLIAQKKALPMIIVMPYGRSYPVISKTGSLRTWENLQEFKKDFFGNLMPFIEQNYRVKNCSFYCKIRIRLFFHNYISSGFISSRWLNKPKIKKGCTEYAFFDPV
jgi:hypothetical protein